MQCDKKCCKCPIATYKAKKAEIPKEELSEKAQKISEKLACCKNVVKFFASAFSANWIAIAFTGIIGLTVTVLAYKLPANFLFNAAFVFTLLYIFAFITFKYLSGVMGKLCAKEEYEAFYTRVIQHMAAVHILMKKCCCCKGECGKGECCKCCTGDLKTNLIHIGVLCIATIVFKLIPLRAFILLGYLVVMGFQIVLALMRIPAVVKKCDELKATATKKIQELKSKVTEKKEAPAAEAAPKAAEPKEEPADVKQDDKKED